MVVFVIISPTALVVVYIDWAVVELTVCRPLGRCVYGCSGWCLAKEVSMSRKSIEERLAQLEAQRKSLQARLSKDERARDTRRKVLLGALVLHRLEEGRESSADYLRDFIRRELPGFLTRDVDRRLFEDLIGPGKAG